ncbi:S-layer homology domain-containing protein [Peptoniphilus sp. KCTC 25270]|uniref:S-layer homology domain-containing protein n=1 Tax=Peptoniphilus sp. KCTC 25270 TaxID=2897414 RepID=UPI001E298232|nr:S-layer homology domain-containing protein [Peptoniphilus sp. KCTC 25270]MCD1147897.1 S-layer homology domain-containing protein [Peptoniphilus sp. KCTC 25270]
MKKRAISFLLAFLMIFTMLPVQIFAQGGENQVRVMVENKTYPVSEGAPWDGVLVDKWVDIDENSTMMSAVKEAIESEGHTQKGAENNYISSINDLGEFSGSYSSGWMGTINDWFTNSGFGDFSVANGTLESGDFIHIQFTNNLGEDLGGSWGNADKSLKAISFASGSLDKEFSPNVYDYILNISADVEEISVTPTAANKNFMVKTTLGETEEKGGVVYKRTANIPVKDGDKITVEIGNPSWPSMNEGNEPSKVYTFTIAKELEPEKPYTKITVANGSKVEVGKKVKHYYPLTDLEPVKNTENTDGTTTYFYDVPANEQYIFIVDHEGKARYSESFKVSDVENPPVFDISLEKMGESNFYKHTYNSEGSDFPADIYLNADHTGQLNLNVGESFQIHPLRQWQVVENTITSTNTPIVEPKFHYEVVNSNGEKENSVVSIDEKGMLKANAQGTAIVLVTYDALNVPTSGGLYSKIWPENTGVMVVSVGQNNNVNANLLMNDALNSEKTAKLAKKKVDAEHDVFYYSQEEESAQYTFTPEDGSTVKLLQPTISENKMSYNGGFTENGVQKNEDNSFTASLVEGKNILEISKGNAKTYQVLKAKKVNVSITNKTRSDGTYMPGDKVVAVFDVLFHPADKLAAIYNFGPVISYRNPLNKEVKGKGTPFGNYAFPAKKAFQTLTFTIPADFEGKEYVLNQGSLFTGGFGSKIGGHRDIDYVNGHAASMNAVQVSTYLGQLPEIRLPMATVAEKIDTTALEETIGAEKALAKADTTSANGKDVEKDKTWVTEDVQKALEKALTNAEEILVKDNATQEEVDKATQELKDAIEGYKPQKGTKALIEEKEETRREDIDFKEVKEEDPSIEEGKEVISQEGQKGEKVITEKVILTDGIETSREVIKEEITKEPVDQIIKIGTKKVANKEALQEAITAEKALAKADTTSANGKDVEKDKTWVTEDVQKALEKALTNAEEILVKDNATQEEVDKATQELKDAIEGYKPQKGIKEENPTKPEPEKKPTPWIPVKPVEKEENKEISKETLKENAEQKLLENKGRFQNMTDIANHWAKPAIQYAMEKGIFYGTSETTFTPNKEATRAEFVTVLGRMANVDPSKYTKGTMKDVASGVYYENYVNWAVEKGIVKGIGENLFEPDRNITREEMATILHRYLQWTQKEYKDRTNKEYVDQNKISDWAKEAVENLSKKELLQGRETGEFDPKANFTRAEVAQVILNLEVK